MEHLFSVPGGESYNNVLTMLKDDTDLNYGSDLTSWINAPGAFKKFNLAVITATDGATSYLAAPFLERPFAKVLSPVSSHQKEHPCNMPFGEGEKVTPRYRKARWVLAQEDFRLTGGTCAEFRERQETLEIEEPTESLTSIYVGCSWSQQTNVTPSGSES
ncbi:hypothetical protein FRC10_003527 [Ceratobasidium sp. 414]|nr:hypothetical protein FRC10_003527 [Ceratobasidium sp. 414]